MQQNFSHLKGDSFFIEIGLVQEVDGAEQPVDLAGAVLVFEAEWDGGSIVKATGDDADFVIQDAPEGLARMDLTDAEEAMLPEGDIGYRIRRITDAEKETVLLGFIKVKDHP